MTVSSSPKWFSGGYDYQILSKSPYDQSLIQMQALKLYARIMELKVPSVCVCTGIVQAAGFFLAVAHDAFKLAGLAEVKSFLAQDGFIFDVKWAFDSDDQVVSL